MKKSPKSAAVFGAAPKNGKKKKLGANMGGLFDSITPKKPEKDQKPAASRAQVRGARVARLAGKLI